jgi:hypothetical protein
MGTMLDRKELRAAGVGASAVLVYALLILASGQVDPGQFVRLITFYVGGAMVLWVGLGIILGFTHICVRARRSGSEPFLVELLRSAIVGRWERDRFVSLLWPPVLFASLIGSFNAFKQMVLPLAGFGADPWLARADRLLFLGNDGWRVTHALFGSAEATFAMDRLYHGWFLPMALGVILCAWLPATTYRLRTQYLLSYIGVWIGLGSLLAVLLPSVGPCFYSDLVGPSPAYEELMRRLGEMRSAEGSQLFALKNQAVLIRAQGGENLVIGGGISAMPSVHNALAALFAIAAWQASRPLGVLLGLYALVIWVGSIHLGWHYGLDGVVAVAATLGIWKVAGRIADRLERPIFAAQPRPALA